MAGKNRNRGGVDSGWTAVRGRRVFEVGFKCITFGERQARDVSEVGGKTEELEGRRPYLVRR